MRSPLGARRMLYLLSLTLIDGVIRTEGVLLHPTGGRARLGFDSLRGRTLGRLRERKVVGRLHWHFPFPPGLCKSTTNQHHCCQCGAQKKHSVVPRLVRRVNDKAKRGVKPENRKHLFGRRVCEPEANETEKPIANDRTVQRILQSLCQRPEIVEKPPGSSRPLRRAVRGKP